MTINQHKTIVHRFFDAIESNDQAELMEVLASDFMFHIPGLPDSVNRETQVAGLGRLHLAFSDIKFTLEDQIAEGDMVASRLTWKATHTGDFQGIPPTGRKFTISAMSIERIQDGKIVERWYNQDELGLMQQLGAIPSS